MNVLEYHRPETIEQALELLGRSGPPVMPIGGGSALRRSAIVPGDAPGVIVVDLQALGLSQLAIKGGNLVLGATLTLQKLLAALKEGSSDRAVAEQTEGLAASLAQAIEHEAAYNLRQAGTVAGGCALALRSGSPVPLRPAGGMRGSRGPAFRASASSLGRIWALPRPCF